MEYITYKEFEREINTMGWKVGGDKYANVKWGGTILASVNKECTHVLDLDWSMFQAALSEEERAELASLCWRLASTPLEDREEAKKYYLKVKPRYNHLFSYGTYFNYNRDNDNICMTNGDEDLFWQTEFTAEECEVLEKRYDLTILERVEVEND